MRKNGRQASNYWIFVLFSVFLNSHAHCGPADTDVDTLPYKDVGESTIISIKDDVSPNTNTDVFRECRIVFRSQRKDGRLCLMQKHFKIQPCEVRLELFDGWAGVDDVENPNVVSQGFAHFLCCSAWKMFVLVSQL